ncbi:MAG: peptidase domain-containing ABC transporter, partial [Saprospiraceae bacterium]|nr:peptidase domain-containing ABC transporter [Saprospiraceae bacterium]
QGKLIELIGGMQEIKLHNAETQKRWEWERTEAKLFRVGMRYLAVDQRQRLGAQLLNELKNILIIVFAAKAVIEGSLTIGVLLAVMYILGQLNAPINQLVEFIKSAQDAKISLERMNEIHQRENEENPAEKITILPEVGDLRLEGVSFQYGGPGSPLILKEL